jgi:hypothetical protein
MVAEGEGLMSRSIGEGIIRYFGTLSRQTLAMVRAVGIDTKPMEV